jgi:hypothetical protein
MEQGSLDVLRFYCCQVVCIIMCHSLYSENTQLPEIINTSASEQTLPSGNEPCRVTGIDGIKYEIAAVGANSALYGFYSALVYVAVINKMVDEPNKY